MSHDPNHVMREIEDLIPPAGRAELYFDPEYISISLFDGRGHLVEAARMHNGHPVSKAMAGLLESNNGYLPAFPGQGSITFLTR